jgi:glycosyltransferase involved in cell wall biosynthesis
VRLVGAFERLARVRPGLKLVLVGASGWRRGAIERRIAECPLRDDIIVPGYLPGRDVTALIRSAAAFCYVSLYEGYGLPVIEALAAGAAVVTSNRSGMIEAAGGAAVLVDPLREDDIARGIGEALERRSALIVAGRERAARRRWADVATEHTSVYRWAAARAG